MYGLYKHPENSLVWQYKISYKVLREWWFVFYDMAKEIKLKMSWGTDTVCTKQSIRTASSNTRQSIRNMENFDSVPILNLLTWYSDSRRKGDSLIFAMEIPLLVIWNFILNQPCGAAYISINHCIIHSGLVTPYCGVNLSHHCIR